ncbi:MAG: hypothetical protein HXX12_08355 [Geothrix sp.]|uniref:NHL repeat-containing protein n=1 Tax=Geothrix sp. TaxID=1962974 RepID=UPI0018452009|nr:NHL repeat-containing protein [Geothrix sp.]NWJ40970.1 hypothetical protein [Geothrix sp.]WIL21034.1 MAG: NHL repeat-containing protein [Geothrix sp.]
MVSIVALFLAFLPIAQGTSGGPTAPGGASVKELVSVQRRVTVKTLVGQPGWPGAVNGPTSSALLFEPHGVAVGNDGTVYISEAGNHALRQFTPDGILRPLAGSLGREGGQDGSGGEARFYLPNSLSIDHKGNLFVADLANHAVRKITPKGVVTTFAGKLRALGDADGPASVARFNRPHGIAVGDDGTVYVTDAVNHTIRKITPDGRVVTVAGKALHPGSMDGVGTEARFLMPFAIAVDRNGTMFVADRGNDAIRKITPDGVVTTLAGKLGVPGTKDGLRGEARFSSPRGIDIDQNGNLYVADYDSCLIRMVSPEGLVTTLAGKGYEAGSADGSGLEARFKGPHGITVDTKGRVFVADSDNHLIRMLILND